MAWTTGIRPDVNWQPLTSPNYISAHMRPSATHSQLRTGALCKPGLLCLHGEGHAAPVCDLHPKTQPFAAAAPGCGQFLMKCSALPHRKQPAFFALCSLAPYASRDTPSLCDDHHSGNKCPSIDAAGCLKRLQQPLTAAKLCVGQPQLSARPTALAHVPTPFRSDSPLIRRGWQSLMKLSCKG